MPRSTSRGAAAQAGAAGAPQQTTLFHDRRQPSGVFLWDADGVINFIPLFQRILMCAGDADEPAPYVESGEIFSVKRCEALVASELAADNADAASRAEKLKALMKEYQLDDHDFYVLFAPEINAFFALLTALNVRPVCASQRILWQDHRSNVLQKLFEHYFPSVAAEMAANTEHLVQQVCQDADVSRDNSEQVKTGNSKNNLLSAALRVFGVGNDKLLFVDDNAGLVAAAQGEHYPAMRATVLDRVFPFSAEDFANRKRRNPEYKRALVGELLQAALKMRTVAEVYIALDHMTIESGIKSLFLNHQTLTAALRSDIWDKIKTKPAAGLQSELNACAKHSPSAFLRLLNFAMKEVNFTEVLRPTFLAIVKAMVPDLTPGGSVARLAEVVGRQSATLTEKTHCFLAEICRAELSEVQQHALAKAFVPYEYANQETPNRASATVFSILSRELSVDSLCKADFIGELLRQLGAAQLSDTSITENNVALISSLAQTIFLSLLQHWAAVPAAAREQCADIYLFLKGQGTVHDEAARMALSHFFNRILGAALQKGGRQAQLVHAALTRIIGRESAASRASSTALTDPFLRGFRARYLAIFQGLLEGKTRNELSSGYPELTANLAEAPEGSAARFYLPRRGADVQARSEDIFDDLAAVLSVREGSGDSVQPIPVVRLVMSGDQEGEVEAVVINRKGADVYCRDGTGLLKLMPPSFQWSPVLKVKIEAGYIVLTTSVVNLMLDSRRWCGAEPLSYAQPTALLDQPSSSGSRDVAQALFDRARGQIYALEGLMPSVDRSGSRDTRRFDLILTHDADEVTQAQREDLRFYLSLIRAFLREESRYFERLAGRVVELDRHTHKSRGEDRELAALRLVAQLDSRILSAAQIAKKRREPGCCAHFWGVARDTLVMVTGIALTAIRYGVPEPQATIADQINYPEVVIQAFQAMPALKWDSALAGLATAIAMLFWTVAETIKLCARSKDGQAVSRDTESLIAALQARFKMAPDADPRRTLLKAWEELKQQLTLDNATLNALNAFVQHLEARLAYEGSLRRFLEQPNKCSFGAWSAVRLGLLVLQGQELGGDQTQLSTFLAQTYADQQQKARVRQCQTRVRIGAVATAGVGAAAYAVFQCLQLAQQLPESVLAQLTGLTQDALPGVEASSQFTALWLAGGLTLFGGGRLLGWMVGPATRFFARRRQALTAALMPPRGRQADGEGLRARLNPGGDSA